MRLAAQAKGGFYPTPPRVIDLIAGVDLRPRDLRPQARAGDAPHPRPLLRPGRGRGPARGAAHPARYHAHRDLRRGAPPRPRRRGRGAPAPGARLRPLPDLNRQRRVRPALSQSALRLGFRRRQAGGACVPHARHPLPRRQRRARLRRAPPAAGGLGEVSLLPLPAAPVLGVPPARAGGVRPGGAHRAPQDGTAHRRARRDAGAGVGGRRRWTNCPPLPTGS